MVLVVPTSRIMQSNSRGSGSKSALSAKSSFRTRSNSLNSPSSVIIGSPVLARSASLAQQGKRLPPGLILPPAYEPYVPPGHELKRYSKSEGSMSTLGQREKPVRGILVANSLQVDPPSPRSPLRGMIKRRNSSRRTQPRSKQRPNRKKIFSWEQFQKENEVVQMIKRYSESIVDAVEEKFRNATAKKRISGAILKLMATQKLYSEVDRLNQYNNDCTSGTSMCSSSSLHSLLSEAGVALFSPLDTEILAPLFAKAEPNEVDTTPEDTEEYPVELVAESQAVMKSSPRILTPEMIAQLVDEALPELCKTMQWNRIYSSTRDGDAFCSFLQKVALHKRTVIVVKTAGNDILGGFATETWKRQEGFNSGRAFYGSGQSFLFSDHPSLDGNNENEQSDGKNSDKKTPLKIFKWTGTNCYSQICDVDDGQIAMGGGGAFGLIVDENFSRGCTGRCGTFDNPPLISVPGGRFDVADFEVYGFETAAFSSSQSIGSTVSLRSLFNEDGFTDSARRG